MGNRINKKLRGLMIPDPRCGVAGLAVNDGSITGSSYTETGPRPGSSTSDDSKSRALLVVTGALESPIEVTIGRTGDPGLGEDAARAVWKATADPASDWRGHNGPQVMTLPIGIVTDPGLQAGAAFDAALHVESQRIVTVSRSAAQFCKVHRSVGVDAYEFAGNVFAGTTYDDICCAFLPSGRFLVYNGDTWYSDDVATAAGSATFLPYAESSVTGTLGSSVERARMVAFSDGSVLLLLEDGGYAEQFASRNLGATFQLVESKFLLGDIASDCKITLAALGDGSVLVTYRGVGGAVFCRRAGSAFDSFDNATEIQITATAYPQVGTCADPRGRLFCFLGSSNKIEVKSSDDFGLTWLDYEYGQFHSGALTALSIGLRRFQPIASRGSIHLIHSPVGISLALDTLADVRCGGWTNREWITFGGGGVSLNRQLGWLDTRLTPVEGRTWLPWALPDFGVGTWLQNGTLPGTWSGDHITIHTVAQDGSYQHDLTDGKGFEGYFCTAAESGSGTVNGPEHGLFVRLADVGATVTFGFAIQIQASGVEMRFRVIDLKSGAMLFELPPNSNFIEPIASGAAGAKMPHLEFACSVTSAQRLFLSYRRSDRLNWIECVHLGALTSGAYGAGGRVAFGAIVAGTTLQRWRAVHFVEQVSARTFPAGLNLRELIGTEINSRPFPLALSGVLDVDESFISMRGGPAIVAEIHSVDTIHDFPIDAAMWDSGPSRAEQWRSESDAVEQILTWAFAEPTRIGDSFLLSLMVLDANFNTAILEIYDGAAWVTVSTLKLDQGFDGLAYDRDGDILRPGVVAGGLLEGGRFLNRGELAGGVARWGGGGVASIVRQSAGGWADSVTNTIQPFVRVDGALAGTGTTSTFPVDVLSLSAPSGVVVAHLTTAGGLGIEAVRVRIQPIATVEGYLRAGLVMVGTVSVFGQQPARGYSVETKPNALRSTSTAGTVTKYEQGAPSTSFSMAWPDGVKLQPMRSGIDVDYLGPRGRPPAVADGDVWGQLRGMIEETRSGEIPIVYLPDVPDHNVTLTDRTLFGFGTLDGSARFNHVLGDEGINEFGRVSGVKLTGIE